MESVSINVWANDVISQQIRCISLGQCYKTVQSWNFWKVFLSEYWAPHRFMAAHADSCPRIVKVLNFKIFILRKVTLRISEVLTGR